TLTAIGQTDSDALRLDVPVRDLCYEEFVAKSGVLHGDHESTVLSMRLNPDGDVSSAKYRLTLAGSRIGPVLGEFDKLMEYPYGCTEQTMSRLMPSVVAMRLHKELGLPLTDAANGKFKTIYHQALSKLVAYQHSD